MLRVLANDDYAALIANAPKAKHKPDLNNAHASFSAHLHRVNISEDTCIRLYGVFFVYLLEQCGFHAHVACKSYVTTDT